MSCLTRTQRRWLVKEIGTTAFLHYGPWQYSDSKLVMSVPAGNEIIGTASWSPRQPDQFVASNAAVLGTSAYTQIAGLDEPLFCYQTPWAYLK